MDSFSQERGASLPGRQVAFKETLNKFHMAAPIKEFEALIGALPERRDA